MRWRKLGRIFKAAGQQPWMQSHTSMPFAEPLDSNRLRIWFTPRDEQNRSHLAWLEERAPGARMTGSGACVFAEFNSEAEALALHSELPGELRGFVTRGLDRHPLHGRGG